MPDEFAVDIDSLRALSRKIGIGVANGRPITDDVIRTVVALNVALVEVLAETLEQVRQVSEDLAEVRRERG